MAKWELYYQAPSDEIFNDLSEKAIEIWATYDDTYGYASEKIAMVHDIANVKDNYMTIVGMFDSTNQSKLILAVKPETRERIVRAMAGE